MTSKILIVSLAAGRLAVGTGGRLGPFDTALDQNWHAGDKRSDSALLVRSLYEL